MVSIRRVFVIVLLIISKIQIIFWFKREGCILFILSSGLRIALV